MLKTFLHEHRITPNALAEEVKGSVSKTSIYNLVKDPPPVGINFATLDVLIGALSRMTGKEIGLNDLVSYVKPQRSEWLASSGALSDVFEHDGAVNEGEGTE